MKFNGNEIPASIFKFYMADALLPQIEYLKQHLNIKTNSELFSKLILHVYGEVQQFQKWQEQQSKEEDPEC